MAGRIAGITASILTLLVYCLTAEGSDTSTPQRYAILEEINGAVEVRLKDQSAWQPAELKMVLHEKDEIRTGKGGYAKLWLDEGAKTGDLELKEQSHLTLHTLRLDGDSGDKTTLLDLAIGRVLVHAQKLQGESKFEVKTPTSTTGVRGTVFEVSVEEKK